MANGQLSAKGASWWDLHELKFWMWAFMRNADVYLQTSLDLEMTARRQLKVRKISQWDEVKADTDQLRHESALAAYNLASTTAVLIRILERSQQLFPSIRPSCKQARHFFKEGRKIRDMLEYAYGRRGAPEGCVNNPVQIGEEGMDTAAKATSTVVRGGVHWIANCFCVEKAAEEVLAIQKAAEEIPFARPHCGAGL